MSGSNERNNENYKHRNENEMKRPILPMCVWITWIPKSIT